MKRKSNGVRTQEFKRKIFLILEYLYEHFKSFAPVTNSLEKTLVDKLGFKIDGRHLYAIRLEGYLDRRHCRRVKAGGPSYEYRYAKPMPPSMHDVTVIINRIRKLIDKAQAKSEARALNELKQGAKQEAPVVEKKVILVTEKPLENSAKQLNLPLDSEKPLNVKPKPRKRVIQGLVEMENGLHIKDRPMHDEMERVARTPMPQFVERPGLFVRVWRALFYNPYKN